MSRKKNDRNDNIDTGPLEPYKYQEYLDRMLEELGTTSKKVLAAALDIPYGRVGNWKRDTKGVHRAPDWYAVIRMSLKHPVDMRYIITGERSPDGLRGTESRNDKEHMLQRLQEDLRISRNDNVRHMQTIRDYEVKFAVYEGRNEELRNALDACMGKLAVPDIGISGRTTTTETAAD